MSSRRIRCTPLVCGLPVLVVAVLLTSCSGGGTSHPTPSPHGSGGVAAARRALCHDLVQIGGGAFRPDNLARLLPKLKADHDQLERAGDPELAASVTKLEKGITKLRAALQGSGDIAAANKAMLHALSSMPSC